MCFIKNYATCKSFFFFLFRTIYKIKLVLVSLQVYLLIVVLVNCLLRIIFSIVFLSLSIKLIELS